MGERKSSTTAAMLAFLILYEFIRKRTITHVAITHVAFTREFTWDIKFKER
jgi:hypothetical protein